MDSNHSLTLVVQGQPAERFGSRGSRRFDACDASIGRAETCDWVLNAEGVSRLHATIRYLNGLYFIEDRSTNGMLLNGAPMGKGDPSALKDGDRLQIDTFEVAVHLRADEDARSTEASRAPVVAAVETGPSRNALPWPSLAGSVPITDGDAGAAPDIDIGIGGLESDAELDPLVHLKAVDAVATGPADHGWNHSPGIADVFRPPSPGSVAAEPVLPENWDRTRSQFTAAQSAPSAAPVVPLPVPPAAEAESPQAAAAPVRTVAADVPQPAAQPLDELFRIVVEGVMDVLRARAELKNSFRLPVTVIQRTENNPLKFAPTAEEAVERILAAPNRGFLSGAAALEDAMDDIRHHQVALLAGVRAAFDGLMERLDPARFEPEDGGGSRWAAFAARNRAWDRYKDHYRDLLADPDECFRRLFGDEFARAYEEQLALLKSARPAQQQR
ncbi:type VI secretion system-associated FHA domain protein TagH [Pseudoxanthomonas putridarboris]|uniref:Type VI secretion system-associated FHA domain protein TagH n=1 Tax=Pseudoxanthomonas putridarboris TaxID=752605 RepID=A0ABU9J394_9GAMM